MQNICSFRAGSNRGEGALRLSCAAAWNRKAVYKKGYETLLGDK